MIVRDVDHLLHAIDDLLDGPKPAPDPVPVVRRFDQIEPEPIRWLWQGWLAGGKLTIFGGHPGDGKSTTSLAIAARLTTGVPMPDGTPSQLTNVLILPSEDGAADTIRPRLEQHGADMTRCFVLDEITDPAPDDPARARPVSLTRDLRVIEAVIAHHNIGLIIIDPITTFMPKADRNAEGDVRDALHPLLKMLERTGCACLGLMHVGKPNGTSRRPLQQLLGSTAFGAIARTVWMTAPDPNAPAGDDNTPTAMVLGVVKSNIWVRPKTLAWSRGLDEPVTWHGLAPSGIDQAISAAPAMSDSVESDAIRFLREELAGLSVPSSKLLARARDEGISESQLRTASKHLKVDKFKEQGTATGQWYWRLPSKRRSDIPTVVHDAPVSNGVSDEPSPHRHDMQPDEEVF